MKYVKNKRAKRDICNLCLQESSLSWDHVPPKGGIELTPVQMETIFEIFAGDRQGRHLKESQNGVKFRTICSKCNSFLGNNYDPVLNKFALDVGQFINSDLQFPEIIKIKTRPKILIKGILAHLLASKIEIDDVTLDQSVREFIFDLNAPIPDKIKVFYWLYPYNTTVIMRDFGMLAKRGDFGHGGGVFNLLKYFPVGYLVSDVKSYEGLWELTMYKNFPYKKEIEIPINLGRVEHPYWPEMVDKGNFVIASSVTQNGISATPRQKNMG